MRKFLLSILFIFGLVMLMPQTARASEENTVTVYKNDALIVSANTLQEAFDYIEKAKDMTADYRVLVSENQIVSNKGKFNNLKFPKAAKSLSVESGVIKKGKPEVKEIYYKDTIAIKCNTTFRNLQLNATEKITKDKYDLDVYNPNKKSLINMSSFNLTLDNVTRAQVETSEGSGVLSDNPLGEIKGAGLKKNNSLILSGCSYYFNSIDKIPTLVLAEESKPVSYYVFGKVNVSKLEMTGKNDANVSSLYVAAKVAMDKKTGFAKSVDSQLFIADSIVNAGSGLRIGLIDMSLPNYKEMKDHGFNPYAESVIGVYSSNGITLINSKKIKPTGLTFIYPIKGINNDLVLTDKGVVALNLTADDDKPTTAIVQLKNTASGEVYRTLSIDMAVKIINNFMNTAQNQYEIVLPANYSREETLKGPNKKYATSLKITGAGFGNSEIIYNGKINPTCSMGLTKLTLTPKKSGSKCSISTGSATVSINAVKLNGDVSIKGAGTAFIKGYDSVQKLELNTLNVKNLIMQDALIAVNGQIAVNGDLTNYEDSELTYASKTDSSGVVKNPNLKIKGRVINMTDEPLRLCMYKNPDRTLMAVSGDCVLNGANVDAGSVYFKGGAKLEKQSGKIIIK